MNRPYKSQYIASALHLMVFLILAVFAFGLPRGTLSEVVWFLLVLPDLPVTVLFFSILSLISMEQKLLVDETFGKFITTYPFNNFWNFWYVTLMYGVLGTVWWFYVPRVIIWFKKRVVNHKSA